jgi:CRISPR/Cas system CSM-associated protein Csm2 small subunit
MVLATGGDYKIYPGKFQKRWNNVRRRITGENSNEWKAAVLEASQMLSEVLKSVGYPGDNLGEKLESMLPEQLDNLEDAKKANKIKNKIVKDENYELSQEEAKEAVDIFGESLSFFEAVDDVN